VLLLERVCMVRVLRVNSPRALLLIQVTGWARLDLHLLVLLLQDGVAVAW